MIKADIVNKVADLSDAIVPLLPSGTPTLDAVACSLGMSAAEVRRKLDRIGSSLPLLIDAVRSGLSLPLLAQSNMTVVHAAKALGFTEPEALSRAFERWWGRPCSPGYFFAVGVLIDATSTFSGPFFAGTTGANSVDRLIGWWIPLSTDWGTNSSSNAPLICPMSQACRSAILVSTATS